MYGNEPFIPPIPPVPEAEPGTFRFFAAARRNALLIWPRQAYDQDVLVSSEFGRNRLLLNGPKAIHRILVENPQNYARTRGTIRTLRPISGNGLLLSEGEEWRHQRRTVAPALAPRVMPMLARHVIAATEETIEELEAATKRNEAVDLLSTVQRLALEIAARSMFALEIEHHGETLRRLIVHFFKRLGRPYFLDLVLPIGIPSPHDFARMWFRRQWTRLMDEIIAERLRAPTSAAPRDLFDMLLTARDPESGSGFSAAQLRDQVATMIVAGHETTALTLFWALYLLASASSEQDRVAEEASRVSISSEVSGLPLEKLAYTRAVVNETLRLFPPVVTLARLARDRDEADGVAIAPRTLILISPWVLHHHTRHWEMPGTFMPTRFLGNEPPRFSFLPFGAGPRVCVGAQFALTEVTLVLAMLVRRFNFMLADDRPVLPVAVITTQPDHRALFRLRPRPSV